MSSPLAVLALALFAMLAQLTAPPGDPAPLPPHGLPVITSVWISTRHMQAGQTVSGRVETSTNVGYVEARIEYRNLALHEDGPGKFSLRYTIPWWLPFWLRHQWTLQVIARSVDGVETREAFPIWVR